MSRMEYNKGKLVPTNRKVSEMSEEEVDALYDTGEYAEINGMVYKVEWESRGEELYSIERASENENGSIDFETYHYNGGGHWTEVVESALKNGS